MCINGTNGSHVIPNLSALTLSWWEIIDSKYSNNNKIDQSSKFKN